MADMKTATEDLIQKTGNFICGVVEGFYGRPWTTEQRKDLFAKMKKWGMDSYVYAPKDDYKHRAYWRELYTVEEAEHLTGLITSAKEHGITFYYAISPGLDITYSSSKEVTSLKRKLEQVSQFGCNAFALLFDDIEPEMSEADKEVFQSFAHAQVSVTNEMYHHLGQPRFLLCPTQYCAARATPNVPNSEYLNTLGSKLPQEVDIMWTGPKVISRTLTTDSIEEISQVLKRPPVIWDNLHANDYDQKRIFLGPYSGRSPDLIPKLRGVLTNPNCEYGANFIAIHTLAQWSRCNVDAFGDPCLNETVSADIKLETEGATEEGPCGLPANMYHPRRALKNAITEWLPEFNKNKPAWGPIAKPQQVIPTPVPIPIIPSVNTCMSLTSTTTTSSAPLAGVNGSQLHALAEVCCTVSTSVMNSLASETKIVPLEVKKTCKVSSMEAMDCNMTPSNSPAHTINPIPPEDAMVESPQPSTGKCGSCTMQVEVGSDDTASSATHMLVDSSNNSLADENPEPLETKSDKELTYQDLSLLCDLFYLPFEHGGLGVHLLTEFQWLRTNCQVLKNPEKSPSKDSVCHPEVEEWLARAVTFQEMANSVNELFLRLNEISNRELLHELYPYVWDIRGVVSLLNSFVQWSAIGEVSNPDVFTSNQYTWFSKGWKEIFMSGNQEPWVFRGGLTADLQRLLPVDCSDLFIYRPPEVPSSKIHSVRPYKMTDRQQVYTLAARSVSGCDLPETLKELPGDSRVGGLLETSQSLCFVVEDEVAVVGYAAAAKDSNQLRKTQESFIAAMAVKYPNDGKDQPTNDKYKELMSWLYDPVAVPEAIHAQHPSAMTAYVSAVVADESVAKRLMACLLAALRSTGSLGVHTVLSRSDRAAIEFFSKLGFVDLTCHVPEQQQSASYVYMGRSF